MEQDINIVMEQFKYNLLETARRSGLPIGMIYYVFKDVYADISSEYQMYINDRIEEQKKAEAAAAQEQQGDPIKDTVAEVVEEALEDKDN